MRIQGTDVEICFPEDPCPPLASAGSTNQRNPAASVSAPPSARVQDWNPHD